MLSYSTGKRKEKVSSCNSLAGPVKRGNVHPGPLRFMLILFDSCCHLLLQSTDYINWELGRFRASDIDHLKEKEEQRSSGWQDYAEDEKAQQEQALQQQLADEGVVHEVVQEMFRRAVLKYKADVPNRIKVVSTPLVL